MLDRIRSRVGGKLLGVTSGQSSLTVKRYKVAETTNNLTISCTGLSTMTCHTSAIGTLRSDVVDGNGNVTRAVGLITNRTILHVHHAFWYISLPLLHDYDMKMPNFKL